MAESDFSGRAAIVTGAGEGIGREIARQLALHGASVVLNDVLLDRAEGAA
ncbi:MAG TPA: SDR family NAD(P)-dependent oxidoreductase, partial [Anaerolineales bacterium]|nr:SDR family NAD(P)-dependent oxidoreductase [Anaerolineales bacterium]